MVDHNPDLHLKLKDAYRDAIVIENTQERGLSGGRNTGVAIATGDVVAGVSSTMTPSPDPAGLPRSPSSSGSGVTGVGGLTRPL